jgi:hypothetical protein
MWKTDLMQGFAAPFQISHPSIAGLLAQHTMKIPDLQRPYAWGANQARELCADLERLLESLRAGRPDPQHFFGTLVSVLHAGDRDDIVDGQQRMTTVTLLLGLLRASFLRLSTECEAIATNNVANQAVSNHHRAIKSIADASADQIRNLLFVNEGFNASGEVIWKPRVEVSPEITHTYRDFLEGKAGDIPTECLQPAQDLRSVARVFQHRLVEPQGFEDLEPRDRLDFLNELLTVISSGLIVVRLATTNADSAYELFESLNARGVPLNALDHLKVWMLSVFSQAKTDSSSIAERMRRLANDDRDTQVRFFENFYEARSQDNQLYDGIAAPKKLVAEARKRVFRDPTQNGVPDIMSLPERISFEVDYMDRLYPVWMKLKQSDGIDPYVPAFFAGSADEVWLRNRLELLLGAVLKHQKGYPYLMVAADRLRDEPTQFAELVHLIEKFFFRCKTICGIQESKIAGLYNSLLVDLDANPGFRMDVVKLKMQTLISAEAPDEVFRAKLVTKLGYERMVDRNRTKYFFEMLDEYCYHPKPRKRPGVLRLTEWHLEHIVPQNPQPGDPSLPDHEINSIGNLCLLPPWINTRLSNRNYAAKQDEAKRLRDLQGKAQIKIELADAEQIFYQGSAPTWSSDDVAKRIAKLQDFACQVFVI